MKHATSIAMIASHVRDVRIDAALNVIASFYPPAWRNLSKGD